MAVPALANSGTLSTTVDSSEHSIVTAAEAGTYQLVLDCTNLAAGEVLEIRVDRKLLTGGSATGAGLWVVYAANLPTDDKQVMTGYTPNTNTDASAVEWTYKQPYGSSRSIPWALWKWS